MSELRSLPAVDKLLQNSLIIELIEQYGRGLVIDTIRNTLTEIRSGFVKGSELPDEGEIIAQIKTSLISSVKPSLIPVINATGVILHTNLGRAPLSEESLRAANLVAAGYSNLEYDLGTGKRGSRLLHCESLLTRLTGAESALVVNNNAAAVLLALSALARRRGVVVARSQLVEIGGGFRVPEVMQQSGARLIEIGTTNRVHLEDYQQTLEENPALFLHTHRSNFQLIGFTGEPELAEIASVAHQAGILLVDDLGSGTLLNTTTYGLGHEPMVQESLNAGSDLVCFSGDKLLGGPQAGIIVGKGELIAKLKKHPLARAIRADKLALASLATTLSHYLKGEAERKIPIWQMISINREALFERASEWQKALEKFGIPCKLKQGESTIGGGSLPGETLPTILLVIEAKNIERFLSQLRSGNPPVIARIQENQVLFDPRTVLLNQDITLVERIRASWER